MRSTSLDAGAACWLEFTLMFPTVLGPPPARFYGGTGDTRHFVNDARIPPQRPHPASEANRISGRDRRAAMCARDLTWPPHKPFRAGCGRSRVPAGFEMRNLVQQPQVDPSRRDATGMRIRRCPVGPSGPARQAQLLSVAVPAWFRSCGQFGPPPNMVSVGS